jgi:hypothetical protein
VIGNVYDPILPWPDGLRVLQPDDALLWKSRASLRRTYVDIFSPVHTNAEWTAFLGQFLSGLPSQLKDNPRWEISLNSTGCMDDKFPVTKTPSSFRIICLGDSWTFGANAGHEQAYPQRLRTSLKQEYPMADFEALNL